ncbi:LysR family transcriptional regulator [Actinoplanes sp. NEAU-A12]|uniref:LysR family transcriptional regulator n=1 Tax=Actinoplanes sandaracinus TaxID=3045177 RepID=A0ABT6WVV8_9ACTN|nr:LysR family transcriptional regulator [Actinoplanes sandaracinus]MDI6103884.1 LysR family transcriptional regulator [Actinoplanes sandaracinus]
MLKTFVVAASTGSIAETAKKLKYGKSTVAYHIREVEKVCQVELFEREVRGLSLTSKGQRALKISEQLLQMTAELKSLPSTTPAGGFNRDRLHGAGGDLLIRRNSHFG